MLKQNKFNSSTVNNFSKVKIAPGGCCCCTCTCCCCANIGVNTGGGSNNQDSNGGS